MWSGCTQPAGERDRAQHRRKSQIQALDRRNTRCRCNPGRPRNALIDYMRHGTTMLFAAFEIATGEVTGCCKPRLQHQEFLVFLRHLARGYPTSSCI